MRKTQLIIDLENNEIIPRVDSEGKWFAFDSTKSLCDALKKNTHCKSLLLGGTCRYDSVVDISDHLAWPECRITHLDLRNNNLDHKGAKALAKGLQKNTSLCVLELCGNSFGSAESAQFLGEMLSHNRTLRFLDLSNCKMDGATLDALFQGLKKNSSLQSLILSKNRGVALSWSLLLEAWKHLEVLHLNQTGLQAQHIVELSEHIHNTTLRSLKLSFNNVEPKGASALGHFLCASHLRELELSKCALQNDGAMDICRAAAQCPHLVSLDLSHNRLQQVDAIVHLLDQTDSLRRLSIEGNFYRPLGGDESLMRLLESVQENGTVFELIHDLPLAFGQQMSLCGWRNKQSLVNALKACHMTLAICKFRRILIGKDCGFIVARFLQKTKHDWQSWE